MSNIRYFIHLIFVLLISTLSSIGQDTAKKNVYEHPPGKFIKVNSANLWIEQSGTGDPLFLISGGPGEAHIGLHNYDKLKDSCTLIFIDNFGRGKSDTAKDVKEYSIARDVEDIEGLRVALGYDKINILGDSYGSLVVQSYAIKYGAHVKHLIIADGLYSGKMWQENDDNMNHEIAENFPEIWDKLMAMRKKGMISSTPEFSDLYSSVPQGLFYIYNPSNFKNVNFGPYPNDFNNNLYYQIVGSDGDFKVGGDIANYDVTTKLKDLKMPVLVIAGRYDRVSVPKMAIKYKEYCPQARFVMFEKSGHMPMIEEPTKTFRIIKEFLYK